MRRRRMSPRIHVNLAAPDATSTQVQQAGNGNNVQSPERREHERYDRLLFNFLGLKAERARVRQTSIQVF